MTVRLESRGAAASILAGGASAGNASVGMVASVPTGNCAWAGACQLAARQRPVRTASASAVAIS